MESKDNPRMARERQTILAMIEIYCRGQHDTSGALCTECQATYTYALARLAKCPFQEGKTTCAKCPIHCYQPAMREKVRAIMRYAGPRMLRRHPMLALWHLVDGRRKAPVQRGRGRSGSATRSESAPSSAETEPQA